MELHSDYIAHLAKQTTKQRPDFPSNASSTTNPTSNSKGLQGTCVPQNSEGCNHQSLKLVCFFSDWGAQPSDILFNCQVAIATMEDDRIDISFFKSHSVRGATCSRTARAGVTTKPYVLISNRAFQNVIYKWLRAQVPASYFELLEEGEVEISTCPSHHTLFLTRAS